MTDSLRFLLAVHILAAVIWVGGGVMAHIFGVRARKKGIPAMRSFVEDTAWLGPRFFAPLSVILLLAGIFLVDKAGYEQSETFVTIGYVGWLISFAIGIGVYPRIEKRLAEADDAAFPEIFNLYANVNRFEITILLLIVIDMAVKPGL